MTAKWALNRVVRDHLSTLVDFRTGRPRVSDYLALYGLPVTLGVVAYFGDFRLGGLDGILSGIAIFTALLFGILVQVFQLKMRLIDRGVTNSDTSAGIDELEANVSYAILVGIVTTIALVYLVAVTPDGNAANRILSAPTVALLIHLVFCLFLILKRTKAAYKTLPFS